MGLDSDNTHAHRIYWQDKKRVSVERNVRFTSNTVTGSVPVPFPSNTTTAITTVSDTIAAGSHTNSANNYLSPNAAISSTSTSTTSCYRHRRRGNVRRRRSPSRRGNSRLRKRQPSPYHLALLKKPAPGPVPPAPEIQPMCKSPREIKLSQKARDIQLQRQAVTSSAIPKTKKKKSPGKDANNGQMMGYLEAYTPTTRGARRRCL